MLNGFLVDDEFGKKYPCFSHQLYQLFSTSFGLYAVGKSVLTSAMGNTKDL